MSKNSTDNNESGYYWLRITIHSILLRKEAWDDEDDDEDDDDDDEIKLIKKLFDFDVISRVIRSLYLNGCK